MARTVSIRLMTRTRGERVIQIRPHWAGEGIAIHKPLHVDPENGEVTFDPVRGYWRLTHIPTALALGSCMGGLERAKSFARAWDAEFAALQSGQAMAPDRLEAWRKVVEEMKTKPPAPAAESEAEGPTDEELLELTEDWTATTGPRHDLSGCPEVPLYSVFADEVVEFARAVLARYGHHFPDARKMVGPAEGEVADEVRYVVKELRDQADDLTPFCELFCLIHNAADMLEQLSPGWIVPSVEQVQQLARVPVSERLPGASQVCFEFVVSDADYCPQARGTAPTYAQAFSEGQHYLAQYQQDGPHTLELRRVEVLNPDDLPLPTVEHPTPVPVTERLPGPEDCDAEGRCWWFLPSRQFKFLDQCARWSLMMHSPSQDDRCRRTHWLPFHALPLPAGEVE